MTRATNSLARIEDVALGVQSKLFLQAADAARAVHVPDLLQRFPHRWSGGFYDDLTEAVLEAPWAMETSNNSLGAFSGDGS